MPEHVNHKSIPKFWHCFCFHFFLSLNFKLMQVKCTHTQLTAWTQIRKENNPEKQGKVTIPREKIVIFVSDQYIYS